MVDIYDFDIDSIESEILMKYDNAPLDYSNCGCLLSLRKYIINKRVLAHQEEIMPDILYGIVSRVRKLLGMTYS